MKKKFEILMVACLFISAFLLARASAALTSSRHAASSKTCIVLDAGQGGSIYIGINAPENAWEAPVTVEASTQKGKKTPSIQKV